MNVALSPHQKIFLPRYEAELKACVKRLDLDAAQAVLAKIAVLFSSDPSHLRFLGARLWCLQAAVDTNQLAYAETGLISVRRAATRTSRIYLEASVLLAICHLRQKNLPQAKVVIAEIHAKRNNIVSDERRRQFQRRFLIRLEEECAIAGLVGTNDEMTPDVVHKEASKLSVRTEDELFEYLGKTIPQSSTAMLRDVRSHTQLQLSHGDRLALPAPADSSNPTVLGQRAFSIVGRIAWRALCSPDSPVYKIWAQERIKIYEQAYLAAAVIAALKEWGIGAMMFASGVVALALKQTAGNFCRLAAPASTMIDRDDRD